jgi:hypothetical protein
MQENEDLIMGSILEVKDFIGFIVDPSLSGTCSEIKIGRLKRLKPWISI